MSISSEITRISNAKTAIAESIANKGVTVPSETKIDGMATLIDSIQTGGASMAENVKYTNADLPNVENVKQALDANTASIKSDKNAIAANTAAIQSLFVYDETTKTLNIIPHGGGS